MPERRAGDVVRVEERVVRALDLLPPEEPAVLGGREGLAQRRAKGVQVAATGICLLWAIGFRTGVGGGGASAYLPGSPSDGSPV